MYTARASNVKVTEWLGPEHFLVVAVELQGDVPAIHPSPEY